MREIDCLQPSISILAEEYVLVQAFKKTVGYMRYHNWYADTLEMDWVAINLPTFIGELSQSIINYKSWKNEPLRLVPAPRSSKEIFSWDPQHSKKNVKGAPFRPLAKVSLKEQVLATAIMMCLADGIETHQGSTQTAYDSVDNRKKIISYGNRLFCRPRGHSLHHTWGSSKFYSKYFQDYKSFLDRPQHIAIKSQNEDPDHTYFIVQSDLSKFYDTVRPPLLFKKIKKRNIINDKGFLDLCKKLFNWKWHDDDLEIIKKYSKKAKCQGFHKGVALPQGLASAGFFSNIVLIDFDDELKKSISTEIFDDTKLIDVCRYVDDLRLVISTDKAAGQIQMDQTKQWLSDVLQKTTTGLKISDEKTIFTPVNLSDQFIVPQSRHMTRIQKAISGGFDAQEGIEILGAIQGLIGTQKLFSKNIINQTPWSFLPITDAKDSTVERFAAGRFRKTYRSLRPLLDDEERFNSDTYSSLCAHRSHRNQDELDDDAHAFSLGLIEKWVKDPSNVRLLRIALDIWPDENILDKILNMVQPFVEKKDDDERYFITCYCLSELFRAGATETGFVEIAESLPKRLDLTNYRERLKNEALRLLNGPHGRSLAWHLEQQILLFLIGHMDNTDFTALFSSYVPHEANIYYYKLLQFCCNEKMRASENPLDAAIMILLIHRSFPHLQKTYSEVLSSRKDDMEWLIHLAELDPEAALKIVNGDGDKWSKLPPYLQKSIENPNAHNKQSLLNICLSIDNTLDPLYEFWDELKLLQFSKAFLEFLKEETKAGVLPLSAALYPGDIIMHKRGNAFEISIATNSFCDSKPYLYSIPNWCAPEDAWRFQLGYLLRFALLKCPDFTTRVSYGNNSKVAPANYKPAKSNWYQRKYGMYSGQSAFGGDWLPISDWFELFLFELLRWPGCTPNSDFHFDEDLNTIEDAIKVIGGRLDELQNHKKYSDTLILRFKAPWPKRSKEDRPLNGCVLQTAMPTTDNFNNDDISCNKIRKSHSNHLASALSAVRQMLILRATHTGSGSSLDLLILPELSVHPDDIKTHLIPFARANKTIILAGITYESIIAGQPLVNSALWILPQWSDAHGLQIMTRRQGKHHLAPSEQNWEREGKVRSFSPAQWLIGYPWSSDEANQPLWLTAAICYDATNMELIADLKGQSDIFIIPAMNRDVHTYDNMAKYLHYGMFQMVIVANSGEFGGSNAYIPYRRKGEEKNCLFHLHGRPQATIAFWSLTTENINNFLKRKEGGNQYKNGPAG